MFSTKLATTCVAMVAVIATMAACGGSDSAKPTSSPTGSTAGSAAASGGAPAASGSSTASGTGSGQAGAPVGTGGSSGSGASAGQSGGGSRTSSSVGYGGISSLTPKQKIYVRKNTPKGVDPAVVIQAGSDICSRLENVASIDKDDLLSALVVKQISGASDAIRYMCPKLLPELRIAQRGFVDGSYAVASSGPSPRIAAGKYRTIAATKQCVWTGFNAKNVAVLNGRITTGQKQVTLSIGTSVRRFESQGCSVWVPV